MITKKGKKTDRTVMMENAIFTYFEQTFGIKLNPERSVSSGIVDMIGFIKDGTYIRDAIAIEIKQAATDFYSGHGLNFVGSSNYIAVPSELVGFTIEFLRDNNLDYVGVLEVTSNAMVRLVTYPRMKRDNDYVFVRFPQSVFTAPHLRKNMFIGKKVCL